jgi:uncharacterized membrane protein
VTNSIHKESHLRSVLKGITWRLIATATTILVAFLITGKTDIALKIGAMEFVVKLLVYYAHERAWQNVPRGTIRKLIKRENRNMHQND